VTVPPAGGQLRLVASLIATHPSRRIRARPEADSRPDSEPECHGHTGSSSSLVVALATARRYHDGTVTVTVTAGPWLACIMFRPDWESSLAPSHALRRLWPGGGQPGSAGAVTSVTVAQGPETRYYARHVTNVSSCQDSRRARALPWPTRNGCSARLREPRRGLRVTICPTVGPPSVQVQPSPGLLI
jgi:hypothetical protein